MKLKLTVLLLYILNFAYAEINTDSLWQIWSNNANADSLRFDALDKLVWDGFLYSNPDSALNLSTIQYNYAKEQKQPKQMAIALNNKGAAYYIKGEYSQSLKYYFKAKKISEDLNDKQGLANANNNIAIIYAYQGFYAKALNHYFKSLKIYEEINDKKGVSTAYNNIGNIYYTQGNYEKALEYYFKSLAIRNELNDKHGIASSYSNIGTVYSTLNKFEKSLEYQFKSLNIKEEIEDKQGLCNSYINIGKNFYSKGDFDKALEYQFKSLKLCEEIDYKDGITFTLTEIALVLLEQKKYNQSLKYATKALQKANEIGNALLIRDASKVLYTLYKKLNNADEALKMFELYTQMKDSLNNKENQKAIQTLELKYTFEKEQEIQRQQHQKQLAIEKKEKEKQKVITYYTAGGLSLVLIFSVLIFNRLQVTRKQKNIIEQQKIVVEEQRKIMEEKNKEITDSIQYAKRIQNAILPSISLVQKNLPQSFILYKPKDIVSGDFYWLEKAENLLFFAVADCTGHGVPGAMVSVVCSNVLTKVVTEEKIYFTDKILNRAKTLITESFAKSNEDIYDGMDISLCCLNTETLELNWSGANNPLYIFRNKELIELKPDKQPVGKTHNNVPFTSQTIQLQSQDSLYLFSDGYADQFGGEKGKKFKSKPFKELLQKIQYLSMKEQKEYLDNFFNEWKGNLEQVDDVCIMGVKI
jgi:serine phosphatase RsbU (regulator of sigma subunit)